MFFSKRLRKNLIATLVLGDYGRLGRAALLARNDTGRAVSHALIRNMKEQRDA